MYLSSKKDFESIEFVVAEINSVKVENIFQNWGELFWLISWVHTACPSYEPKCFVSARKSDFLAFCSRSPSSGGVRGSPLDMF